MKIEEVKKRISEMLIKKKTLTAQEINYAAKGAIPPIQIHTCLAGLVKSGAVELKENDGAKSYTLLDESKLNEGAPEKIQVEEEKEEAPKEKAAKKKVSAPEQEEEEEEEEEKEETPKSTKDKFVQGGRDLTKYKFDGQEGLSKGRLALAIIKKYAKEKKPSYKAALELFPHTLVPPYGLIKTVKEAKEISKERARFFIKDDELVKLKDEVVAVSNQWTKERIDKLISIAKKQLGYSIK